AAITLEDPLTPLQDGVEMALILWIILPVCKQQGLPDGIGQRFELPERCCQPGGDGGAAVGLKRAKTGDSLRLVRARGWRGMAEHLGSRRTSHNEEGRIFREHVDQRDHGLLGGTHLWALHGTRHIADDAEELVTAWHR